MQSLNLAIIKSAIERYAGDTPEHAALRVDKMFADHNYPQTGEGAHLAAFQKSDALDWMREVLCDGEVPKEAIRDAVDLLAQILLTIQNNNPPWVGYFGDASNEATAVLVSYVLKTGIALLCASK